MFQIQVESSRSQVLIPAWDYNIDPSESEMACHYSNSGAPGDLLAVYIAGNKQDWLKPIYRLLLVSV